jgi:alanine racemase
VAIAGQLFPIIGRISMDMLCVDISAASSDIALGEAVELFGSQVCVAQLAAQADTIAYEILCNIHERVERVFLS